MQLNADKTKVTCFHETAQACNARKRPCKIQGKTLWPASVHILSMFPDYITPAERPHQYPGFACTLLQEVKQFDYSRPDPIMNMQAAVAIILEKANKGNSLALAVSDWQPLLHVVAATATRCALAHTRGQNAHSSRSRGPASEKSFPPLAPSRQPKRRTERSRTRNILRFYVLIYGDHISGLH